MELGVTFPLQWFLKREAPSYGTEPNRRLCWDLHVIDLRGRKCLLAVHCHSRYTFVRYDGTSAGKEENLRACFTDYDGNIVAEIPQFTRAYIDEACLPIFFLGLLEHLIIP